MKFYLFIFALLLTACGGGGGGSNSNSGSETFSVTSITPENDAVDVERDIVLQATFNAPVSSVTINDANISLEDRFMNAVVGDLSVNADETIVSYTPDSLLSIYSPYSLLVDASIEDQNGKALGGDFIVNFKTRDGIWNNPEAIDTTTNEQLYHKVARNQANEKVAVWSEGDIDTVVLKASIFDEIDGWNTAQTISGFSESAIQPAIAINENGDTAVLYTDLSSPSLTSASIYFAYHLVVNGSSWFGPKPITSETADSPNIVIKDNGDIIALFRVYDETNNVWVIGTSYYSYVDGEWAPVTRLSKSSGSFSVQNLQLAANDSGDVFALWGGGESGEIWTSRFDGTDWGNTQRLATDAWGGRIIVNDLGEGLAVWRNRINNQMVVSQFVNDRWSASTTLPINHQPDYGDIFLVGNDDHALLVWSSEDNVWAARFQNYSSWDTPIEVAALSAESSIYGLEMDNAGNALLVWERENNNVYEVWSQRYLFDDGWQTPLELDEVNSDAEYPYIDMTPSTGEVTAIWVERDMVSGSSIQAKDFQ